MTFQYTLHKTQGRARRGEFSTPHGSFQTPQFMPVGTQGSVKGIKPVELTEAGAQIVLTNTYHLWLRPGEQLVQELGGIHRFMGWSGPILSDSGGFQVFSLKGTRKLSEEGVHFQSHVDGSPRFLSPELAIKIQETLGVDIAMMLDECPSADLSEAETERSLEMTLRWAQRGIDARTVPGKTAMFGITQGGCFKDLRTRAAEEIARIPFNGYAIGGLSVGEGSERMYQVLSYHPEQLPADKIRYLMGVGTPRDIVEAVRCGVDLFDCVMPTRSGRFGRAFTSGAAPYINIRNACFAKDSGPIEAGCLCAACRQFSRGYLHHLFRVQEMLGPMLLSLHNVHHYLNLMARIRTSIEQGTFEELYREVCTTWTAAANEPEEESPV